MSAVKFMLSNTTSPEKILIAILFNTASSPVIVNGLSIIIKSTRLSKSPLNINSSNGISSFNSPSSVKKSKKLSFVTMLVIVLNVVELVNSLNITSTVFSPATMFSAGITTVALPSIKVGVAISTSFTLMTISPVAPGIVTVTELSFPNITSLSSTSMIIS